MGTAFCTIYQNPKESIEIKIPLRFSEEKQLQGLSGGIQKNCSMVNKLFKLFFSVHFLSECLSIDFYKIPFQVSATTSHYL